MDKNKIIQLILYSLNLIGAGILGFYIWFSFKLWVNPPIDFTKEASLILLKKGLISNGLDRGILALLILIVLIIITWIVLRISIKRVSEKELAYLFILKLVIVLFGLIIGMTDCYEGLSLEIEQRFEKK